MSAEAIAGGPIQGVGIGLRAPHYTFIERERPAVPWLEVLADNYLGKGGSALHHLERIRRDYAVTFHGVGMSLGSADPLDMAYLRRLKRLMGRIEPAWVSDHLCWTCVDGRHAHDLLPLPYVEEAVEHVATRIGRVQDFLGQRILVENVSTYLGLRASTLTEWEFLVRVAERSDCDILLDINNIYVSACNTGFAARDYLSAVPVGRVREFHLAGYEDRGSHLLDTHGEAVHEPVWDLYGQAIQRFGPVPTLIEWDNNIPGFSVLLAEAARARACLCEAGRDVA
jgi:hypothetical protein